VDEASPPGHRTKKGGGSTPSAEKGAAADRGGKPRERGLLTPEAIIEAASRIADVGGIDAVSIRRVAAALDARPMSLYIHFDSKDELMEAVAEKALGDMLLEAPLPRDWREALSVIGRTTYATFVSRPWLITVLAQRPVMGASAEAHAEQFAKAVEGLPYKQAELWWFIGAMNDYIVGHSLRAITAPGSQLAVQGFGREKATTSPELAALPDYLRSRDSIERFEFGLKLVLDGIEQRYVGGDRTAREEGPPRG
jgi:AcrR family transcriptional regulator